MTRGELKRKYGRRLTRRDDSQRVDRNGVRMLHVRSSSEEKIRAYVTRMQSEFYPNGKHDVAAAIYTLCTRAFVK